MPPVSDIGRDQPEASPCLGGTRTAWPCRPARRKQRCTNQNSARLPRQHKPRGAENWARGNAPKQTLVPSLIQSHGATACVRGIRSRRTHSTTDHRDAPGQTGGGGRRASRPLGPIEPEGGSGPTARPPETRPIESTNRPPTIADRSGPGAQGTKAGWTPISDRIREGPGPTARPPTDHPNRCLTH